MEGVDDGTLNGDETSTNCAEEASSCRSEIAPNACPFLKCNPGEKESNYVDVVDPISVNSCGNEEVEGERSVNETSSIEDGVKNEIFAKEEENGCWLLRWNVAKHGEDDFIGLCFEGNNNRSEVNINN